MKNLILILLVFGLSTFGYSHNGISHRKDTLLDNRAITTSSITDQNLENCDLIVNNTSAEKPDLFKECEVRVDVTLENGTRIEGTVIFSDVSWFDCATMQLGAWWKRNF